MPQLAPRAMYAVDKIERQLKDGHDPQPQDLVDLISIRLRSSH